MPAEEIGVGFQQEQSIAEKLSSLRKNNVFARFALSLSGLYFVVTGIQYWMPDYLRQVFGATEEVIAWYYSALTFTGPISGVVIGGIVTSKLGGYNDHRAQKVLRMVCFGAVAVCIPSPLVNSIEVYCTLLWLLLFFGGFILPPLTGIMLSSVENQQKASANSLANLAYNAFGYFPSPIFYGLVSQISGGGSSRWPMGCLLYSTMLTISFLRPALDEVIRKREEVSFRER